MPINRLNNHITTAWFNVKALPCNDPERYYMSNVYDSAQEIFEFIESDSVKCDWILAGFSMGSCMSLAVTLLSGMKRSQLENDNVFEIKKRGYKTDSKNKIKGTFSTGGIIFPELA